MQNEKKKFFVEVNHKYVVSVESTSNGGAEHVILDNIRYVKSALAFDNSTWKTDMFIETLIRCKVISYEELKGISDNIHFENVEEIECEVSELESKVKNLKAEIKAIENKLEL